MTFGTFRFTGRFNQLGGAPAIGHVVIESTPKVIRDTDAKTMQVSPVHVPLSRLGSFSINLTTDATAGNSTTIQYTATVVLRDRTIPAFTFWARQIGSVLYFDGITRITNFLLTENPARAGTFLISDPVQFYENTSRPGTFTIADPSTFAENPLRPGTWPIVGLDTSGGTLPQTIPFVLGSSSSSDTPVDTSGSSGTSSLIPQTIPFAIGV